MRQGSCHSVAIHGLVLGWVGTATAWLFHENPTPTLMLLVHTPRGFEGKVSKPCGPEDETRMILSSETGKSRGGG